MTPSLGIATSPEDAIEANDLIEKASIALKSVQSQLGQEMSLYNTSLSESTRDRVEMISSMRQAINNSEFHLVYQPIIDLKTQAIMGTEALIRWIKPNGDFVSPGDFIPVAEETGLILPISNWVIKEVLKQSALWQSKGVDLRISLNLSAVQFSDSNLLTYLEETLEATGANPKMIAVELTEYSLMNDEKGTLEILNAIKSMGFTIYLDDFGTGYSSLSYVHKLPIDTLKVDRAFIKDYPEKQDTTILAVVYELSRQFNMTVVIEGIENNEQKDLVTSLGYEYAQGYLFSKPIAPVDVEKLYKMQK
jgi:EAL domain-containing protein (putative c-di-GMP-specific phosphodiesterase class I)